MFFLETKEYFTYNLVVWRVFVWLYGFIPLGYLAKYCSVIWDKFIRLFVTYRFMVPSIMSKILRKQCVNILFQLGVFYNIQRKSHFYKTLIFRILSEQRNIMEYHFAILIIWRSQVQALAGPQVKAVAEIVTAFFVINVKSFKFVDKSFAVINYYSYLCNIY